MVENPVRVEFVGGPLCGVVWWPWTNSVASNWNFEVSPESDREIAHSELQPQNVPEYVHMLGGGMICAHFHNEEYLYLWRDGDVYDNEPYDESDWGDV